MILVINTANEETFLGLYDNKWLELIEWEAGRELSAQILIKLEEVYKRAGKEFNETTGVIVSKGPGSFTGLRIGLSIANAFAYSLKIPIVGLAKITDNEKLLKKGQEALREKTTFDEPVTPEYGREPNISKPKKA
jgi:tRNA threonylcarbamoyl adenosine modification protein YeaZ